MIRLKRICLSVVGATAIATTFVGRPVAADPFRTDNPRSFDSQLEAAFNTMFVEGNYIEARSLLETASTSDPMTHAMQASFAYLESDWETLGTEAEQTLSAAERLVESDPLRGHLYTAVGHFMVGAHTISTRGTVQATPIVLNKLRLVFDHLGQAEDIAPDDPELNLIKGYMDLMISVNLPFSSPDEAIERFRQFGSPSYLVQRGIAIAYRDLDNYDEALTAVNEAISETPDNSDLYYLKAQILRLDGDLQQSLRNFEKALEHKDHYPTDLAIQIAYEMCRTRNDHRDLDRNCRPWAEDYIAHGGDDETIPPETSLEETGEAEN